MKALAVFVAVVSLLFVFVGAQSALAGPLPGAIFTTVEDGSRVNANIYEFKEDVYLDGGPGPNAPIDAAGLPEGDYFFQVTDPPGKVLLSTDDISCRKFHVNADGIISYVYPATCSRKIKGRLTAVDCTHKTGTDIDHGALTIQLMPYLDTPNPGGVYKVWVTPVQYYAPPAGSFGFIPSWSKTDNFKVKEKKPCDPAVIKVFKFDDSDADGIWDEDENAIVWHVSWTDPVGSGNSGWTSADKNSPLCITASVGDWVICEDTNEDWQPTALEVDGQQITTCPDCTCATVTIAGVCGEQHTVKFGNIELGRACASKWYDQDADGAWDSRELPISPWPLKLDGTNCKGEPVSLTGDTGPTGEVCFEGLLPGSYVLSENAPVLPWHASTDISSGTLVLEEGGSISAEFGNYCTGSTAFGTKGFWHNKNGLAELTSDFVNGTVNTLPPYSSPSSYFDAGDEPFNGTFADGTTPVDAGHGSSGEEAAPAGSWKAEVSSFLVDSNSGGDPREQLAQQLLAFIFNCRYRLGGLDAGILCGGTPVPVSGLVDDAISAWGGPDAWKQNDIAGKLDALNNCTCVEFIHCCPCSIP